MFSFSCVLSGKDCVENNKDDDDDDDGRQSVVEFAGSARTTPRHNAVALRPMSKERAVVVANMF